jgi:hypothetical protein
MFCSRLRPVQRQIACRMSLASAPKLLECPVIVIVITNQDSTSSRLLPGSSYSCCILSCVCDFSYSPEVFFLALSQCTQSFYAPVGHYKWFLILVASSLSHLLHPSFDIPTVATFKSPDPEKSIAPDPSRAWSLCADSHPIGDQTQCTTMGYTHTVIIVESASRVTTWRGVLPSSPCTVKYFTEQVRTS